MANRLWNVAPIDPVFSHSFINEHYEEEVGELNRLNNALPFKGVTRKDYENFSMSARRDRFTGELVRGPLELWDSLRQSGDMYFKRGYTATHAGAEQLSASLMLRTEEEREKLKDTKYLKYSSEGTEFLKSFSEGTVWNFARMTGRTYTDLNGKTRWRVPIDPLNGIGDGSWGMAATPEDIFKHEAPEGWTPKEALKEMEEVDPDMLQKYQMFLGGEEEVKKITKDTRNPYEFFYRLNEELQNRNIAESLAYQFKQNEEAGKSYINWYEQWGKEFLISSIINDPDMAGSLTIAAALTVTTGIGGVIAEVIHAGAKIGRYGKTADRLLTLAAGVHKVTAMVPKGAMFLPENLGPSLIRLKFGAQAWKTKSFVNRAGWITLGNIGEGTITGALAELSNQTFQIDKQSMDEYHQKEILRQAMFEAAISPIINPILGSVMFRVPRLPLYTMSFINRGIGKLRPSAGARGTAVGNYFKSIVSKMNIDHIGQRIQGSRDVLRAAKDWGHMLGQDPKKIEALLNDEGLVQIFAAIMKAKGIDESFTIAHISEAIADLRKAHDENVRLALEEGKPVPATFSEIELGAMLARTVLAKQGLQLSQLDGATQNLVGDMGMRLFILGEKKKKFEADKIEMTWEEFAKHIEDNDPELFWREGVPQESKKAGETLFEEQVGGNWGALPWREKLGWAMYADDIAVDAVAAKKEIKLDEINKISNEVDAIRNDIVPKTEKEIDTKREAEAATTENVEERLEEVKHDIDGVIHATNDENAKIQEELDKFADTLLVSPEPGETVAVIDVTGDIKAEMQARLEGQPFTKEGFTLDENGILWDDRIDAEAVSEINQIIEEVAGDAVVIREVVIDDLSDIDGLDAAAMITGMGVDSQGNLVFKITISEHVAGLLVHERADFRDAGRQTVAHEVGHAVHDQMTDAEMKEFLAILEAEGIVTDAMNHGDLTQEAFADLWAMYMNPDATFHFAGINLENPGMSARPKGQEVKNRADIPAMMLAFLRKIRDRLRIKSAKAETAAAEASTVTLENLDSIQRFGVLWDYAAANGWVKDTPSVQMKWESNFEGLKNLIKQQLQRKLTPSEQTPEEESLRRRQKRNIKFLRRLDVLGTQIDKELRAWKESEHGYSPELLDAEIQLNKVKKEHLDLINQFEKEQPALHSVQKIYRESLSILRGKIFFSETTMGDLKAEVKVTELDSADVVILRTLLDNLPAKKKIVVPKTARSGINNAVVILSNFLAGDSLMSEVKFKVIQEEVNLYLSRQFEGLAKTMARTKVEDKSKEVFEKFSDYNTIMNELIVKRIQRTGDSMLTAATIQDSLAWQESSYRTLEAYGEAWTKIVNGLDAEGKTEMALSTLLRHLPRTSRYRINQTELINVGKLRRDSKIKTWKAKEIFHNETGRARKSISKLDRNAFGDIRVNIGPLDFAKNFAHEVTSDTMLNVPLTADFKKKNITPGTTLDGSKVVMEETVMSFEDWRHHLELWHADPAEPHNKTDEGDVIITGTQLLANLDPDFRAKGVGLASMFRGALINQWKTIEDLRRLNTETPTLKFRYKDVATALSEKAAAGRLLSHIESNAIITELAEQAFQQLDKHNNPSLYNAHDVAIEVINQVESSFKKADKAGYDMFGFVLRWDDENGLPVHSPHTVDKDTWISAVKKQVVKRLEVATHGGIKPDTLNRIYDIFGIRELKPDAQTKLSTPQYEQLADIMVSNLHRTRRNGPTIDIADFGNGNREWHSAYDLGNQIVDAFTKEEMYTTKQLYASKDIHPDARGSEAEVGPGEKTAVQPPLEGDLNFVTRRSLWEIDRIMKNGLFREGRIAFVLNRDNLTSSVIKAYNKVKEEGGFRFPEGTIHVSDVMPVSLIPYVQGDILQQPPMTQEQVKKYLLNIALNTPQQANTIVHDKIIAAKDNVLRLNQKDGMPIATEFIGMGGDFGYPYHMVGMIRAMELGSVHAKGLTKNSINLVSKLQAEWQENHKVDLSTEEGLNKARRDFFDHSTGHDMMFSGRYLTFMQSRMGDPKLAEQMFQIEKAVAELLYNEDLGEYQYDINVLQTETKEWYRAGTLHILNLITGLNQAQRSRLGAKVKPLLDILQPLRDNDINTLEDWKIFEDKNPNDPKVRVIRAFMKLPLMRAMYGMEKAGWLKIFRDSEGTDMLKKVYKTLEIELDSTDIEHIGDILFHGAIEGTGQLMYRALGLEYEGEPGKSPKAEALKWMEMDRSADTLLTTVKDLLKSHGTELRSSRDSSGREFNKLYQLDTHEKYLKASIETQASVEFRTNEPTAEQIKKIKDKYAPLREMEDFLKQDDIPSDFGPGHKRWNEYKQIPYKNLMPESQIGAFRAFTTLNSSGYRIAIKALETTARHLGLENFNADIFLGLERYVFYHNMLPSEKAVRGFDTQAGSGMSPIGIGIEKVLTNEALFKEWATTEWAKLKADRKAKGDTSPMTIAEYDTLVRKYIALDPDRAEILGTQELVDGGLIQMYKENGLESVEAEIEMLMLQNELLYQSTYGPPQLINYHLEDDIAILNNQTAMNWFKNTVENADTRAREKANQEQLLSDSQNNAYAEKMLELVQQAGNNLLRSQGPIKPYVNTERARLDVFPNNSDPLTILNQQQKGVRAFDPLYTTVPYTDKPNFFFLKQYHERKMREISHTLDLIVDESSKEQHVLDPNDLGYPMPWKEKDMPKPVNTVTNDLNNILQRTDISPRTSELFHSLNNFAKRKGTLYTDALSKLEDAYPYMYLTMKMEEAKDNIILAKRRFRTEMTPAEITALRAEWLGDLHTLSQFSRDTKLAEIGPHALETAGMDIAFANVPSEAIAIIDQLQSIYASEDKPNGLLFQPTMLQGPLKMGLTPADIRIQAKDDQGNPTDELVYTDLEANPLANQNMDMSILLFAIEYPNYIKPIIDEHYPQYSDIKTFEDWTLLIDPKHKVEIEALAAESVTGADGKGFGQSIVFDMSIMDSLHEGKIDPNRVLLTIDEANIVEVDGEQINYQLNHLLSKAGFGFFMQSPSAIKGKTLQMTISHRGALKMMLMLENHAPFRRMRESMWAKIPYGTVETALGEIDISRPTNEILRDKFGHNMRASHEDNIELHGALSVMAKTVGEKKLKPTYDPTRGMKGSKRFAMTDLDYYSVNKLADSGLVRPWLESHISVLSEVVTSARRSGYEMFQKELFTEIDTLIEGARKGEQENIATAIAFSVMFSQGEQTGNWTPDHQMMRVFMDERNFNEGEVSNALMKADLLLNKIAKATDLDTTWFNNPINLRARAYIQNMTKADLENFTEGDNTSKLTGMFIESLGETPDIGHYVVNELGDALDLLGGEGVNLHESVDYRAWLEDREKVINVDIETNLSQDNISVITLSQKDTGFKNTVRGKKVGDWVTPDQAQEHLNFLEDMQNKGYKVAFHNGVSFDTRILGNVAGSRHSDASMQTAVQNQASRIAIRTVDSLDNGRSFKGEMVEYTDSGKIRSKGNNYYVSLSNLAKALGIKQTKSLEFGGLEAALLFERVRGETVTLGSEAKKVGMTQEHIDVINNTTKMKAWNKFKKYAEGDAELGYKVLYGDGDVQGLADIRGELTVDYAPDPKTGNERKVTLNVEEMMPTWLLSQRESGRFHGTLSQFSEWENVNTITRALSNTDHTARSMVGFEGESFLIDNGGEQLTVNAKQAKAAIGLAIGEWQAEKHYEPTSWLDDEVLQFTYNNVKSAKKFREFAIDRDDAHLENLGITIEKLVLNEYINNEDAVMFRAMILRLNQINPFTVKDITMETIQRLVKETKPGSAERVGDSYKLRIGEEATQLLGKTEGHMSVVQMFAHELSHLTRLRFVDENNGTWQRWLAYAESNAGKAMMLKLVTQWHGGIETQAVLNEVDGYIRDPEEFIAAQTSFFLLNDVQHIQADFTADEYKAYSESVGIVTRIINNVRDMFRKIADVFVEFEKTDSDAYKEMVSLVTHTLGYKNKGHLKAVRKGQRDGQLYWMDRIEVNRKKYKYSLDDLKTMVIREKQLEKIRDISGMWTTEQATELVKLKEQLQSADATDRSVLGFTRAEQSVAWEQLTHEFSRFEIEEGTPSGERILDIVRVFNEGNSKQKAQAMDWLLSQIQKIYGSAITAKSGEFFAIAARKAESILPGLATDRIRSMLTNLMAANTGAQYTWNSISIMPVLLTALLDDEVVTTFADFTKGDTPSVRRTLDAFNKYSDLLNGEQGEILSLINSIGAKALGTGPSEHAAALMQHINEAVLRGAQSLRGGAHFNIDEEIHPSVRNHPKWAEIKVHILGGELRGDKVFGMIEAYKNQIEAIESKGIEIGEFSRNFIQIAPWYFSKSLMDGDNMDMFWREMPIEIDNHIRQELDKKHAGIDPLYFFQAGLLPRVDTFLMADLKQMETTHLHMLRVIAGLVNKRVNPDVAHMLTDPVDELFARLESENVTVNTMWREATSKTVGFLMSQMGRQDYTFKRLVKDLKIYSPDITKVEINAIRLAYKNVIGTDVGSSRLSSLRALNNKAIPSSVWAPGSLTSAGVKMKTEGLMTAADMHTRNILVRASGGVYFSNDSWSIPSVLDVVARNDKIRSVVSFDTPAISGALLRGVGDRIFELNMMHELFGIYGDYRSIINLFAEVVDKPFREITNPDGTLVNTKELLKSAHILLDKWRAYRHIKQVPDHQSSMEAWLFKNAPNFVKIVFGPSLSLASLSTEHTLAMMSELLGKRSIGGFARQALGPLTSLSKERRKRIARSMASSLTRIDKAFLPDSQMPATMDKAGFLDKWSSLNMRIAHHVHESIGMARTENIRLEIADMIKDGKIENLIKLMHKSGDQAYLRTDELLSNPDHLIKLAREAKIGSAFDTVIITMNKTGLLNMGTFAMMQQMVVESTQEYNRYYDTNEMLMLLLENKKTMDNDVFRMREDIIQALRDVETAYVHDVMVQAKPMDTSTRGGMMDYIFELFRKYPVLFFLQHVMRKSSRHTPIRWATGVMALMLLDVLYMMLLRISMGNRPEDIIKAAEDDPVGFFLMYGSRLPIFGRYGGLVAEGINIAYSGINNQTPGAFIPSAAITAQTKGIIRAVGDPTVANLINASRTVPGMDPLIRMALIHGLGGKELEKKSKGSGTSPSNQRHATWGLSQADSQITDLMLATELVKYLDVGDEARWLPQVAANQRGNLFSAKPMPAEPAEAPAAPTMESVGEPSMVSRMEQPGGSKLADLLQDK